jgi:uncharacterized protein (UPF0264 family)
MLERSLGVDAGGCRVVARLLVSVKDSDEAAKAASAGADLVDAKDPSAGALGWLSPPRVKAIHDAVAGRTSTSAVAGDDGDVRVLAANARALSATGVSFVKLGLGAGTATAEAISELGRDLRDLAVVAVLFADERPDPGVLPSLARAGFAGAMLDTRAKTGRRLLDFLSLDRIAAFVEACREHGLMSGLAGSLRIDDIPILAPLGPGYLGFRGGLCAGGDRTGRLDPGAVRLASLAVRSGAKLAAVGSPA